MTRPNQQRSNEQHSHSVRLPGFLVSEEIGLGDAIKRVTYAMGIRPCTACNERAGKLNSFMVFSPRQIKGK